MRPPMQCASVWAQGWTNTGSAAGNIFEDVQHKRCKQGPRRAAAKVKPQNPFSTYPLKRITVNVSPAGARDHLRGFLRRRTTD